MASLCGIYASNFFSKSTRPRDMLFVLKDTLSIKDKKTCLGHASRMKNCLGHVDLSVP